MTHKIAIAVRTPTSADWVAPYGVRHCILSMVGTSDSRSCGGMMSLSSTTSGVLKLILNDIQGGCWYRSVVDKMASSSRGLLDTWYPSSAMAGKWHDFSRSKCIQASVSLGALCAGSCSWRLTVAWEHNTGLSKGGATSLRSLGVLQTGEATPTPQCHVAGHVHVYHRALSDVTAVFPCTFEHAHMHSPRSTWIHWVAGGRSQYS